jgi:hypothetical protein
VGKIYRELGKITRQGKRRKRKKEIKNEEI